MKLLILIFLTLSLFASSINKHQIKILEKIMSEISIDKQIMIWSDNPKITSELKNNTKFIGVDNCEEATVIILENKKNLTTKCEKKYIFVLNYRLLSDVSQSFGALFWKKGRPNIIILEPRIKSQSIKISKNLEPYLETKIW